MHCASEEEYCGCTMRSWIAEEGETDHGLPRDRFGAGNTNEATKTPVTGGVSPQDLSPGICFSRDFSVEEHLEAKPSTFINKGVVL